MLGQGAEAQLPPWVRGVWERSCLSASVPMSRGVWIQVWGSPSGGQVTSPGIQEGQRDAILSAWLGQVYSPPLLAEQSAKKTIELHKNPSWKPQRHP